MTIYYKILKTRNKAKTLCDGASFGNKTENRK